METQAPIIFGQDLVSTYGILNYNIEPDKFRAVEPPAPAPEEFVVNDERCVLPFSAAMLDAASLSDLTTTSNLRAHLIAAIGECPYDDDTQEHIHKEFPARERTYAILRRFDDTVYDDKLNESTIKYEQMRAKLIKPFNGAPPRRMNRKKHVFLRKWLQSVLERHLIRRSHSRYTSPLLLIPKPPDRYRVT